MCLARVVVRTYIESTEIIYEKSRFTYTSSSDDSEVPGEFGYRGNIERTPQKRHKISNNSASELQRTESTSTTNSQKGSPIQFI